MKLNLAPINLFKHIKVPAPLDLLPHQSGLAGDELKEEEAQGNTKLDVRQRSINIGEPVPIVFARRVTVGSSDIGGVFVAPGASSGRFVNDSTTNELTVNFQLILSQGQIGDIKENQLYQRACRKGTWKRAYGERASNWTPAINITAVANKTPWENIPTYCGTDAVFTDLTVLSFTNTAADGDTTWDRQCYVYVENGLKVTRILDSQLGSSNNFIDLAIYLIKESNRLPDDLIDTTSMTAAANFLNTNNFLCNGVFNTSENLEDWLIKTGNQFLLRFSEKDGKKCFKPRLPLNADHTINSTGAISPVFGFSEDHILDGSFEIEYIPITERQDAKALVMWRQQPDNDIGIIRTSEVKQTGVTDPVIIQYDLSRWCCSESHAIKYGAYQIAKRRYITHTVRISVRPSTFNSTLALGDIVRVKLRRETNAGTVDYHDYLYEVERIEKATTGIIQLDLIHFPVDSSKRSIIARAVVAATAIGTSIPTGRTDLTCHSNTGTGNIADDGITWPSLGGTDFDLPDFDEDWAFEDELGNPNDPFDSDIATGINDDRTDSDPLAVGDTITATGGSCAGGRVCFYRRPKDGPAVGEFVPDNVKTIINCVSSDTGTGSYELTADDIDHIIGAEWSCPDPGSSDGFGTPHPIGETQAIEPDVTDFTFARWTGTKTIHSAQDCVWNGSFCDPALATTTTTVTNVSSNWYTFNNYLTIGGGYGCALGTTAQGPDDNGTFIYPVHGPVEWRANVKVLQASGCGGGTLSVGGLGVDGQGAGCGYAQQPSISFGCVGPGSYWAIEGKWEFSNDTGTTKNVAATWGGRSSANDGFN
tara:strand:+ start:177 stop:2630 length:2454 start_codon:yes stop_codon:yes gene_type:complete